MMETPRMASASMASSSYALDDKLLWHNALNADGMAAVVNALNMNQFQQRRVVAQPQPQQEQKMADAKRRIVKIYIMDPDENVPVEKCLLLETDAKLTEATDQELFFECDIKSIMDKHNAYRVTLIDKKVKEREQKLEPARIRDLKMTVVTLAAF